MNTKTRYLADDLGLPANWQAERYSTTIRLLRDRKPGETHAFTADVVLPYGSDNSTRVEVARIVRENP